MIVGRRRDRLDTAERRAIERAHASMLRHKGALRYQRFHERTLSSDGLDTAIASLLTEHRAHVSRIRSRYARRRRLYGWVPL